MKSLINKLSSLATCQSKNLTLEQLPMFSRNRVRVLLAALLTAIFLSGCGGSDVESGTVALTCDLPLVPDAAGANCVAPPPIQCDPPTVPDARNESCVVAADPTAETPVFFPGTDQAVLYYNRNAVDANNSPGDTSYEGWRLHTWSNDACDAYADDDTEWANGRVHDGIDPFYGAYWILDLKPGYAGTDGACGNFIIHIGTEDSGKEMGGGDFKMPLSQDDPDFARMNFTFSGVPTVFEFPIESLGEQPVKIEGAAAHWLDTNTLVWNTGDEVASVKLHYSTTAGIEATLESGLNGTAIDLVDATLTDEQRTRARYLADWSAYSGDWTADDAKAVLKGQVVAGGYNTDGKLIVATAVQTPLVLDALYTWGEEDADEATLGAIYSEDGSITAALWAPTAQSVKLNLYSEGKTLSSSVDMVEDPTTGIWTHTGGAELDRQLYRYELSVFHPVSAKVEILETTDPYSVSVSTNSRFSRFVNLTDDDLYPEGWMGHTIPEAGDLEDGVIYEGHIRDFSVRDESVSAANRGKYMAFTETDSVPVQHLKALADAGMKYFHILPANDIATIEEDESRSVGMDSTVAKLCDLNRRAAICQDASVDRTQTLQQVFDNISAVSNAGEAQELVNDIRGVDRFNWGYDPYHFSAPEGSYSSDPDGVARIIEMRAMNQALHELGLRVVVDVVFNHTSESGLNSRSVLDKTVPGYYHRYNLESGAIERSTCCENTATEHKMMSKLTTDSLVMWASQYKFDGFRFDLMGHMTKDSVLDARTAVQMIDEDTFFYGEGWNFGEVVDNARFDQATQRGMAGTEVGTFNDQVRDPVRNGLFFFNSEDNLSENLPEAQDKIKMGLAGTLSDFVFEDRNGNDAAASTLGAYALDPADIINYVSVHDTETLWDKFQYTLPDDYTLEQRVRAQGVALSVPMMAQGIPFFHMGSDLLRSKSMDIDSFDSGDWFNYIDFTMNSQNWAVGLPIANKNESNWTTMSAFFAAPERAASMTEIEYNHELFKELLSIRDGSKLFRLTTAQDIFDRVGFHNVGKNQTPGLIVMSIDDGVGPDAENPFADIDPMVDAIVVVINATEGELSHTVPTAAGFELHSIQASSIDPMVRGASFVAGEGEEVEGTFTVPALTTAVFVIPQMGDQGAGLSALATSGAPDVVPYGSTLVYLRGSMNDWGAVQQFVYQGDGIYETTVELTANTTYNFKVADADWGSESGVNFGPQTGDATVVLGEAKPIENPGDGNISFTPTYDAPYTFSLNAAEPTAPELTVNDARPFGETVVYLRGVEGDWGTNNPMTYDGEGVYTATIALSAGEQEFKVADADWGAFGVNFGVADGADQITTGSTTTLVGSNNNVRLNVETAGDYVFSFDASDLENLSLELFAPGMYGATEIFVRGGHNGWAADTAMTFDGSHKYSVELDLTEGDMQFKVADADWADINMGESSDGSQVTLGDRVKIEPNSGGNMQFSVPATGTYVVEVKGPNPANPSVVFNRKTN